MGDQRPWFKLWGSALKDEKLEALSLTDWARWARLGLYLKGHGTDGSIDLDLRSQTTARGIVGVFRVSTGCDPGEMRVRLLRILSVVPGVKVECLSGEKHLYRVSMVNWHKYQDDTSRERTKSWRDRRRSEASHQPSPPPSHPATNGDGVEEKRRETPLPPVTTDPPQHDRPRIPPEAYHTDCPEPRWVQMRQCVSRSWLATHPGDWRYPAADANGTPKQCPHHRAADA